MVVSTNYSQAIINNVNTICKGCQDVDYQLYEFNGNVQSENMKNKGKRLELPNRLPKLNLIIMLPMVDVL